MKTHEIIKNYRLNPYICYKIPRSWNKVQKECQFLMRRQSSFPSLYLLHTYIFILNLRYIESFQLSVLKIKKVTRSYYSPGQDLKVGKVVSPTYRPRLPPTRYSWYSFLLEAETAGRIVTMKNSNYTIRNRTLDLPVCSTVPHCM